jgi:hypothetical protein
MDTSVSMYIWSLDMTLPTVQKIKKYSILYYLLYYKNNKLPIFIQHVVFICVILG